MKRTRRESSVVSFDGPDGPLMKAIAELGKTLMPKTVRLYVDDVRIEEILVRMSMFCGRPRVAIH